jgi:hypothetical protein
MFEGMIEGFLFQRKIDWSGHAHTAVFNQLKVQYSENLSNQKKRLKEIEHKNVDLTERFETVLKDRDQLLQHLHASQTADFRDLTDKSSETPEAIRKTYDQELALQKPVQYWQTRDSKHLRLAKIFGWTALGIGVLLAVTMGGLIYWIFVGLKGEKIQNIGS